MDSDCFQLLYFSRAAANVGEAEIEGILATAELHNSKLGITGMLLHEHDHFLQLIEGEENAVINLYARIRVDPRHRDVAIVFTRKVKQREFENWSMGHSKLAENDSDLQSAFREVCATGAAPTLTVHRHASADQLIDYMKVLLSSPPPIA